MISYKKKLLITRPTVRFEYCHQFITTIVLYDLHSIENY